MGKEAFIRPKLIIQNLMKFKILKKVINFFSDQGEVKSSDLTELLKSTGVLLHVSREFRCFTTT